MIDWGKRYSDAGEDYHLRMMFDGKDKGHYVEVGVWEPKNISNTYIFYEMGWNGVLIEPVGPWARKAAGERPRDIVVNKAISTKPGPMQIFLDSAATSVESSWTNDKDGGTKQRGNVMADTLENVMDKYPDIRDNCDFASIDVEGHEKEVLLSNNWSKFRPGVIILEAVEWRPFKRVHDRWEYILKDNGYKFVTHNIQNRFYAKLDNNDFALANIQKWGLQDVL